MNDSSPPAPISVDFVAASARWSVRISGWEQDDRDLAWRGLAGSSEDYHALGLELFDEWAQCPVEDHQHVLVFRGRPRVRPGRYPLEVIIDPTMYQHREPWASAWGPDGFIDFGIQDAVMYAAAATAFYTGIGYRPRPPSALAS